MSPAIAIVLGLPDELLMQILGLVLCYPARPWCPPDFDNFYRNCVSVMLVCHRFRRLATPYLYEHIDVTIGSMGPNFLAASLRATEHLHRTLSHNPSLREHCRVLHVYIGKNGSEAPLTMIQDFATWLARNKRLIIDATSHPIVWRDHASSVVHTTPDPERIWDFIRIAVRNMLCLEELSLTAACGLLHLSTIVSRLRDATRPGLVSLTNVSFAGVTLPWSAFKTRSAPITSLVLDDFQDTPENLGRLLLFPAKLESFTFTSPHLSRTEPWNLSSMATALSPHKSTLRTLFIGTLLESSLAGFDLRDFTRLEELSLSYWATGCEAGTEARLLAPRLREFTWSLHIVLGTLEQDEKYFNCEEQQQTWLRKLAQNAIEQRVPLRKIHINFEPSDYRNPGEPGPDELPWDGIARLKKEMRDEGISLSYD